MSSGERDPYVLADKAAAEIAVRTGVSVGRHDVALVLGSGWRSAAETVGETTAEVPFGALPGFPTATVAGHAGTVRSIALGSRRVLCLLGRVHAYEGYSPETVVHGVRTAVAAGCRVVVLTNAAGTLSPSLRVGQAVLIADHLNLTGRSPLVGPRFVDLSDLYSSRLRALARAVDPTFSEAVYAALPGPNYETPAEVRMLRTLGADLVGMSTAWEAIAAREAGAEVLGISLVTNPAAGTTGAPVDHTEVLTAGAAAADRLGTLLSHVVQAL